MKYGSASVAVRRLQRALNAADAAGLTVTGVFEGRTTAAVKSYQRGHGLAQTGVVTDGPLEPAVRRPLLIGAQPSAAGSVALQVSRSSASGTLN